MNEKALLIGNGINRIKGKGVDWETLLEKLRDTLSIDIDIKNEYKPFPLRFQELIYHGKSNYQNNLQVLKKKISSIFDNTPFNDFHFDIMTSNIKNILTTNYDYAFEKTMKLGLSNKNFTLPLSTREIVYSLKRKYEFPNFNKVVWHIHGELNDGKKYKKDHHVGSAFYNETSIMIGYDHYSDYLTQIQKYIKGKKDKTDSEYDLPLTVKLNYNEGLGSSWVDFFFTHDLIIIGFSLDFSENHLWWLLDQRARYIKRYNKRITNKIIYTYPKLPDESTEDLNELAKQVAKRKQMKAKVDILKALLVEHDEIECSSYKEYYELVIDKYIKI